MKNLVKIRAAAILAAAVFSAAVPFGAARAGTDTEDLSVTASVAANCTIATSAVAFGAYDPVVANASANLDGTGTVTVTCTNGATGLTIGLGLGLNANVSVRRMIAGAGEFLTYELYQETGRTTVWGTTTAAKSVSNGTGSAQAYTVFGRVASGQNAVVGSYSDTVVATVNF